MVRSRAGFVARRRKRAADEHGGGMQGRCFLQMIESWVTRRPGCACVIPRHPPSNRCQMKPNLAQVIPTVPINNCTNCPTWRRYPTVPRVAADLGRSSSCHGPPPIIGSKRYGYWMATRSRVETTARRRNSNAIPYVLLAFHLC